MGGMEQAFGRTLKQSEAITSRLIDSACSEGMWVLLHADLRKYGEFVTKIVWIHPPDSFQYSPRWILKESDVISVGCLS